MHTNTHTNMLILVLAYITVGWQGDTGLLAFRVSDSLGSVSVRVCLLCISNSIRVCVCICVWERESERERRLNEGSCRNATVHLKHVHCGWENLRVRHHRHAPGPWIKATPCGAHLKWASPLKVFFTFKHTLVTSQMYFVLMKLPSYEWILVWDDISSNDAAMQLYNFEDFLNRQDYKINPLDDWAFDLFN